MELENTHTIDVNKKTYIYTHTPILGLQPMTRQQELRVQSNNKDKISNYMELESLPFFASQSTLQQFIQFDAYWKV